MHGFSPAMYVGRDIIINICPAKANGMLTSGIFVRRTYYIKFA